VDIEPLRKAFNQDNMFLINDFAAQVLACRTEAVAEALEVKAGWPENGGPLAAIGAGTGLGHAALIPNGRGGFIPAPSEAGHASFTFIGPEELDFEAFLLDQTGRPYPYGDLVVSGSGLAWLHQWLTGKEMSPPEVAETINAKSRTTRLFARFYGRAARNYALTVLPLGGLYVAGGVAAQNPFLVTCTDFQEEFTHSVHYQRLLRQLPVFLNTNEDSGLYGAAYWAQMRLDRLI
jgi:glucokinase